MRVWIVSHAYAAPVNHDKLRALAALPDVHLTLLAPGAWPTPFGTVELPKDSMPYRVVEARTFFAGRVGAYLYREGFRELRRGRPDLVHAELEPWSLAALQCVLLAGRAPIVLFTWENLGGPRRLSSRAIERFVLRRLAFVIAGNEAARRRVGRRGFPLARTKVLPQFGVSPERYRSGEPSRAASAARLASPVVGYVGRLVPEKAVEVLVEAVSALDARLLVVGDGPERQDLIRRVAGWPPHKACFVGAVGHEAIPDYLACLDVLVLPSRTTDRWAEQFGHVLIEAMAAGVPVVGSSSGAIPEVLDDAGLVFREDDVEDARRVLRRVLEDAELRSRLIARGRERIERCYTHAAIAAAHREIWGMVLSA